MRGENEQKRTNALAGFLFLNVSHETFDKKSGWGITDFPSAVPQPLFFFLPCSVPTFAFIFPLLSAHHDAISSARQHLPTARRHVCGSQLG